MIELKARTARSIADEEEMLELGADSPIESAQVYIKSEADKVIAEKDKEIAELKDKLRHYPMMVALLESDKKEIAKLKGDIADLRDDKKSTDAILDERNAEIAKLEERIADGDKDFDMADSQNERLFKIVRHQKYKRCLAMAWWCSAELGMLVSTWEFKIKHYKKWQKRWLELAEKFKEAK